MIARILVVEDETLIALDLADQLKNAGYDVIGPATTVVKAQKLIRDVGCDAALLDVNLGNETAVPIAFTLREANVPFIFISGNSRDQLPHELRAAPWLSKPVLAVHLLSALNDLAS
jgi:DNA-binding response OmpR family regulator